jgi:hypothetical protein
MSGNDSKSAVQAVQVTDALEIAAIGRGEIIADYYASDDEFWADARSLEAWRASRLRQAVRSAP